MLALLLRSLCYTAGPSLHSWDAVCCRGLGLNLGPVNPCPGAQSSPLYAELGEEAKSSMWRNSKVGLGHRLYFHLLCFLPLFGKLLPADSASLSPWDKHASCLLSKTFAERLLQVSWQPILESQMCKYADLSLLPASQHCPISPKRCGERSLLGPLLRRKLMSLLLIFAQSEPQRLQGFLTLHRGDPKGETLCVVLLTPSADFPTVPGRWCTTTFQTSPWRNPFHLSSARGGSLLLWVHLLGSQEPPDCELSGGRMKAWAVAPQLHRANPAP